MDRYVPLPPLPQRVSRLNELAYDLWWSWNAQAREVFRDLDYPLWRFTDHNPVLLLHLVEPERLEHAAADPPFLSLYDDAIAGLDAVRGGARTWWARQSGPSQPIAWVSPEFALHQSLPVNASRLGVLAGDFCREASDLEVPIVGRCSSCFPLSSPGSALPAHLSTADGWWMDGFTGANGWMIDGGRMRDAGAQDAANARALYRLIEEDLVRAFYERDRAGVPDRWAALMAASVATTVPRFSARRMVKAFAEEAYLPALRAGV